MEGRMISRKKEPSLSTHPTPRVFDKAKGSQDAARSASKGGPCWRCGLWKGIWRQSAGNEICIGVEASPHAIVMPKRGLEPPLPLRELAPEASASASSATSAP